MTGSEKLGAGAALILAFGFGVAVGGRQQNPARGSASASLPHVVPVDTAVRTLAPAAPSHGRWQTSEDVSKIDDSKAVTLTLDADTPISGWPGKTYTPTLIVRCQEKRTSLYIVNGMQSNVEYGTDGATVTLRVDSTAAFKQEWSKSTDNEALFAPAPMVLARRLAHATRLLYRFVPFNSSPAETSFTLTGLDDELPKVAAACKWAAQ